MEPNNSSSPDRIEAVDQAEIVKQRLRRRFWSTVDYLSIVVQIFVVYTVAVLFDLLLAKLFRALIQDAVNSYPVVQMAFEWFEIALAFLGMILVLIHSVFSVYSHIRIEVETRKEELPRL